MDKETLQAGKKIEKDISDYKSSLDCINRILGQKKVVIVIVGEAPPAKFMKMGTPQYELYNPELAFKILREEREVIEKELTALQAKLQSL